MAIYVRPDGAPAPVFQLSEIDLSPDLDAAYFVVARLVNDSSYKVAGWKMGGSTPATCEAFSVVTPYFGPLYEHEVFQDGATVSLVVAESKAEPEIAVRVDAAATGIDAWAIAVELPSSPIENLLDLGIRALVADRCAAGALVVGAPRPLSTLPREGLNLTLMDDTRILTEGRLDTLIGAPDAVALSCLSELRDRGFPAAPGQWIATGGLGPCVPVPRRSSLRLVSEVGELSFMLDLEHPS